jgi:hypothetical protein
VEWYFEGYETVAWVIGGLAVVMALLGCVIFQLRLLWKQRAAWKALKRHEDELSLAAAQQWHERETQAYADALHRREHEERVLRAAESLARVLLERR